MNDEKIKWYQERVGGTWDDLYKKSGHRAVHQTHSEQNTIYLGKAEMSIFLFPEKEKVLQLLHNKQLNPRPTFIEELYLHKPITDYIKTPLNECIALDYGCGGLVRYSLALAKYFKFVYGVDACDSALKMGQNYIDLAANKPKGAIKNVQIQKCNGTDLVDFKDESIDFIFSNLVFQHIGTKEVYVNLMHEFHRVLKPGGIMRFGAWTEKLADDHQSVYDGNGYTVEESKELYPSLGFTLETITAAPTSHIVWVTLKK